MRQKQFEFSIPILINTFEKQKQNKKKPSISVIHSRFLLNLIFMNEINKVLYLFDMHSK